MNSHHIQLFFERLRAANPHPTTELHYRSTFELLIAVMLSAQSTDVSVNKVTPGLFAQAPTPRDMLRLGVDGVADHIRTLGLFNSKARHVVATCQRLVDDYEGEVPDQRAALESLPGVGRKTANVILNTAFGQPTMAVDTHIFRVGNRTGLAPGRDVRAVEQGLLARIPAEFMQDAHHWLILHGRYTCTARQPHCDRCLVSDLCDYRRNASQPSD